MASFLVSIENDTAKSSSDKEAIQDHAEYDRCIRQLSQTNHLYMIFTSFYYDVVSWI